MLVKMVGKDVLSMNLKDFWERSVLGFGSFSQEISKSVYDKHVKNDTESVKDCSYKIKFKEVGDSFYVFIVK